MKKFIITEILLLIGFLLVGSYIAWDWLFFINCDIGGRILLVFLFVALTILNCTIHDKS